MSENYPTVGSAMGRWEPLGSVPHQWQLGDELRFVTAPSPPAAAAATAGSGVLGALAAGLGLAGDTSAAGGAEVVEEARRRVRALLESKTVHFDGAGDTKTVSGGVEQAWSVDYAGDRAKAASNREVLDAI